MKSNPSEMNMEITEVDLSETEWKNRFLAIVEEARSENVRLFDKNYLRNFIMNTHQENVDADDVDDKNERLFNRSEHIDPKKEKIIIARRKKLMSQMSHIFDTQPRFKQICKHYRNKFVSSGFTTYVFRNTQDEKKYNHPVHELHEESNDLKYIIDLCGFKLTCLDATRHCFSQVMPLINNNCPNLRQLQLAFKEINSEDFVNAFSNMLSLRGLVIKWSCKTPLPTTLIRSLEQIGGTLTYLFLRNNCMQNDIFLPESSALVFPQLIALNKLCICGFKLRQSSLEAIGEMKNLVKLGLSPGLLNTYSVCDEKMNMYPIGNLKTLKHLQISWDWNATDKFLINLCNNAKQLQTLHIVGTNITDNGIIALDKLKQLDSLNLGLSDSWYDNTIKRENKFITDKSISCLHNEKLSYLSLSNCINITNRSVIKFIENLPNLTLLSIEKTNVTIDVVDEIPKSTEYREKPLFVFVSFKDHTGTFESATQSFNIHFETPSEYNN
ncbi:uncharacterized protein LOC122858690 [Aphidius gifuensis]|uniref:uncharacterized protein LOC122858690 n=1 Tax=Aphidius gifuensis TaxID=684658 RepID=UPI001CDCC0D9|nr:uncharacterized protein LOC122858690 [Aphidius gifuensis]